MIGAHGLWLIPLSTTIGGLLSGALVYGLAPKTEGHGTDTVVKALHWTGGQSGLRGSGKDAGLGDYHRFRGIRRT